jgi:hypothetical protein
MAVNWTSGNIHQGQQWPSFYITVPVRPWCTQEFSPRICLNFSHESANIYLLSRRSNTANPNSASVGTIFNVAVVFTFSTTIAAIDFVLNIFQRVRIFNMLVCLLFVDSDQLLYCYTYIVRAHLDTNFCFAHWSFSKP